MVRAGAVSADWSWAAVGEAVGISAASFRMMAWEEEFMGERKDRMVEKKQCFRGWAAKALWTWVVRSLRLLAGVGALAAALPTILGATLAAPLALGASAARGAGAGLPRGGFLGAGASGVALAATPVVALALVFVLITAGFTGVAAVALAGILFGVIEPSIRLHARIAALLTVAFV